ALLGLLPNSAVSVEYHSLFGTQEDLMLLEVDDELLPEFLHRRLVALRGQIDEDAVLCTASKTYAVKFVGSSNSVFLIPPSDEDDGRRRVVSVIKVASGCMELVEVAPKLDELKVLLSRNPYSFAEASEFNFPDEEECTRLGLFRWDDLVDRLQASDSELRMGLQSLSAIEIDGFWRMLDEDYMNSLVNIFLHNITLNDWSVNALIKDEVVAALQTDGFPRNISEHCFELYCSRVVDEGCMWKLNEKRVCVHLARETLKTGKMKKEMFMEKWSGKVPIGISLSFDVLEGEVLIEKMGVETWVKLFSVSSLPSSPAERFARLFEERPKWDWKDLEPFVRDLKVPGLSSEGLLLKYTRRSQPSADSEPAFSAR
ncbi:hypothetical protein M569_12341, partial [Genlisea aurea]